MHQEILQKCNLDMNKGIVFARFILCGVFFSNALEQMSIG